MQNLNACKPKKVFASGWRALGIIICLMSAMSCVSKREYAALEKSQRTSQRALERQNEEIVQLNQKLKTIEKEYNDLQERHNDLIKVNQQLFEGIQKLKVELDKKKSVIHIQQQVIRLLDDARKTIESSLNQQIAAVESSPSPADIPDAVKFILVDKLLFESGSTVILPAGRKLLKQIASSLETHRTGQIIVAGHTDEVVPGPDLKSLYPTNWELSSARASAVVRFLLQHSRIEPSRMVVCGYGSHRPSAANDTPQGRQINRRIEIYLVPENYLPSTAAPAEKNGSGDR